ncbi:ATP-binding protein [Cellulomonas biazotea]|uniref:ATP-binding protein n=1 Tax=Cellulomonas biazotea TaxID=1709 RepID=UPI001C3F6605|nr:ATP-binding protein [Cellulomonas biazotea]
MVRVSGFVGRSRELAILTSLLETVRTGRRADPGVALTLRGRRRVGKSRMVDEFLRRTDVPSVYFQAARHAPLADELAELTRAVVGSTLPDAVAAAGTAPTTVTAALTLLAAALPADTPSVVVVDELPWLLERVPGGAGELQRVWDTRLSKKPVLLLLLGSDLAMMEHLLAADQPFHGRATEMVLDPLTPTDVATMTGLSAAAAFDAHLVTGGLPLVVQEWEPQDSVESFLRRSFASSTSALVVAGGRSLDSEFPATTPARQVLTALGGRGERTFGGIQGADRADGFNATTLTTTLRTLTGKRVVEVDEPLSARPAPRNRRYRLADPALRFWLAFVEPALGEVDRGRPDLAMDRVHAGFGAWRGRAVEPVVRQALGRLLPDDRWPVTRVGGWWPRSNVPEVDLVGMTGDHGVGFVGTVKWRTAPLTTTDVDALARDALAVPGVQVGTPLVGVCPGGTAADGLATVWDADDLLRAWA